MEGQPGDKKEETHSWGFETHRHSQPAAPHQRTVLTQVGHEGDPRVAGELVDRVQHPHFSLLQLRQQPSGREQSKLLLTWTCPCKRHQPVHSNAQVLVQVNFNLRLKDHSGLVDKEAEEEKGKMTWTPIQRIKVWSCRWSSSTSAPAPAPPPRLSLGSTAASRSPFCVFVEPLGPLLLSPERCRPSSLGFPARLNQVYSEMS